MKNGTCWTDDAGRLIQAHGGMIARFDGLWYWYGENKDADNIVEGGVVRGRVPFRGVSCYTSRDLHSWHFEGLALAPVEEPGHPLSPERIVERPKVLRCPATGQYVMWFHADRSDYTLAHAGLAVANRPQGPFRFVHLALPNRRDCRDMTLFEDPLTGKAYLVHSGDWNKTLYFSELTDDYTDFTGVCHAQMVNQEREAPVVFVREGVYHCLTSGCTGWTPNTALLATARTLAGGLMKLVCDPMEGPGARRTFGAQATWSFECDGQRYLLLDHWQRETLRTSGYSILPVCFDGDEMTVRWQDTF